MNVGLYGPTYFHYFLKSFLEQVKSTNHKATYHIIFILTDGAIHDMAETKDVIVELSHYPVSIIIVGLGDNEDFSSMEELDGDDVALVSKTGEPWVRDIVQFV